MSAVHNSSQAELALPPSFFPRVPDQRSLLDTSSKAPNMVTLGVHVDRMRFCMLPVWTGGESA